jgi:hypothetical protein
MPQLNKELANLALQIINTAQVPGQAARAVVALQEALTAIVQGQHVVVDSTKPDEPTP